MPGDERRQHQAGDPVRRHPLEFPPQDRQEAGTQQGQYRCRHRPVIQPVGQAMPHHPLGFCHPHD